MEWPTGAMFVPLHTPKHYFAFESKVLDNPSNVYTCQCILYKNWRISRCLNNGTNFEQQKSITIEDRKCRNYIQTILQVKESGC